MRLNQAFIFISDFSEYSRWSQRTKIKYKLHYGWCTRRRFTAATLQVDISYEDVSLWDQKEYTKAMTSGQMIKVKDVVQGRILSSIKGSKLKVHMLMHFYQTNPTGIYKIHDLMIYFSRPTDFGLWPDFQDYDFCHGSFLSSTDGSKLIFYQMLYVWN